MTRYARGKMIAAGLVLGATSVMVLPTTAAANHIHQWPGTKAPHGGAHHHRSAHRHSMSAHHRAIWRQGYRAGYAHALHEAHGDVVDPVVTGRSAAVGPIDGPLGYDGPFAGDGLLGTGVLNGRGVLGTGVLGGTGLLGIGIAGF